MEQWTIVIVLLTIAIILLFASFFVKDNDRKFADEMSEYTLQLTEEIHELKQTTHRCGGRIGKRSTRFRRFADRQKSTQPD